MSKTSKTKAQAAEYHVYECFGPSGRMETTAASLEDARSNLRYRLHSECHMKWYDANRYDLSPIRLVR